MTGTAANRIQFNRKLSTAGKEKKGNYMEITAGCGDGRKNSGNMRLLQKTRRFPKRFSNVRAIIQEFCICFTFVVAVLKGR